MLLSLKRFSYTRTSWFLLMIAALFLEGSALFFQHKMELLPCVMCIYERVATLGVFFAALIGMISPKNPLFRWTGLIVWAISAGWGFKLAREHVSYQFPDPNVLFGPTCDLFVQFPSWMPLNEWMPWMFEATGDCSEIVWQFLTLSMPQWLEIIFAIMLVVLAVVLLSQLVKDKKNGYDNLFNY